MILDNPSGLFEACQRISPINPAYANLPIEEGFNWSLCLDDARFEELYLVVFRSVRRPAADLDLLKEHDDRAYEEAVEAGGLLRYFKGEVNGRGECLSFCLWESRERAVTASASASHRKAARTTAQIYESYTVERYELARGEAGDVVFRRPDRMPGRENALA
jgi:hypothetical protein